MPCLLVFLLSGMLAWAACLLACSPACLLACLLAYLVVPACCLLMYVDGETPGKHLYLFVTRPLS